MNKKLLLAMLAITAALTLTFSGCSNDKENEPEHIDAVNLHNQYCNESGSITLRPKTDKDWSGMVVYCHIKPEGYDYFVIIATSNQLKKVSDGYVIELSDDRFVYGLPHFITVSVWSDYRKDM